MSDEHSPFTRAEPEAAPRMPASEIAEKATLCSFLLSPREVGDLCAEAGVTHESFYHPAHAAVYGTLYAMHATGEPIDIVTVGQRLRDTGKLAECGGAAYVSELGTFHPSAMNAARYIATLQEKLTLRRIIETCTSHARRAYEEQDDVPALSDALEKAVLSIREGGYAETAIDPKQDVMDAIGAIQDMYERRGAITGLATGLPVFDKMVDGLKPALLYVIAARPSMGKSSWMMQAAEHIAVDLGQPVAVFSLEMSKAELWQRQLASRAKVNISAVRDGFLKERDFPALTAAASKMSTSGLYIEDAAGISIQQLRARARRLKKRYGVKAIFIDYLQLMSSNTKRGKENRQQEVSEISVGLKGLAKELQLPVVVLAQLNRDPEKRTGASKGRPRLADLRESGSIEQDADVVGLLIRDEYYAETEEAKKKAEGKATLIVAKQRSGPLGDIPLTFLKEFTRFETRAHVEEEAEAEETAPAPKKGAFRQWVRRQ